MWICNDINQWTFYTLLHWNLLVYLKHWMNLLFMYDVMTLCICYLENYLENYADFSNVGTFNCTISPKSNLAMPLPNSSEKSLGTAKLSWWQTQIFQNSKFCMKAQILSLATNTASYILDVTSSCHWLLIKLLPNTQFWIIIVCELFLQVNIVLQEKTQLV